MITQTFVFLLRNNFPVLSRIVKQTNTKTVNTSGKVYMNAHVFAGNISIFSKSFGQIVCIISFLYQEPLSVHPIFLLVKQMRGNRLLLSSSTVLRDTSQCALSVAPPVCVHVTAPLLFDGSHQEGHTVAHCGMNNGKLNFFTLCCSVAVNGCVLTSLASFSQRKVKPRSGFALNHFMYTFFCGEDRK